MKRLRDVTLFCLAFAAVVVFIDPRGEFPLDDDWSFSLTTWHFAEHGEFVLARFTAMSLRAQVVWGALWTLLFGESFTVLRASTLTLSFASIVVLGCLLRQLPMTAARQRLALLLFVCNPIFVWASFTYMTHVPFAFLQISAVCFAVFGVRRQRVAPVAVGCVLALVACLIRQTGLAVIMGLAAFFLMYRDSAMTRWRASLAVVGAALGTFFLLYFATDLLSGNQMDAAMHATARGSTLAERLGWAVGATRHAVVTNLQFGALVFAGATVLIVTSFDWRSSRTRLGAVAFAIPFVALAAASVGSGQPFPYGIGGNVIENLALGPLTLRDTFVFKLGYPRALPPLVLGVATYLLAFSAALIALWLARSALRVSRPSEEKKYEALLLLQLLSCSAFLIPPGFYFDRYVLDSLWALPLLVALTVSEPTRAAWRVVVGATIVAGVLGVVGTREYLDWNRARWSAFEELRRRGVTLEQLDGGVEINQYLLGGFSGPMRRRLAGFSVEDDRYILAFQPVSGYRELFRVRYRSGLFGRRSVYALERTTGYAVR